VSSVYRRHLTTRHVIAENSSARKPHGTHIEDEGIEIPDFKFLKGFMILWVKCFIKVLNK
jgi:hypothetical protein